MDRLSNENFDLKLKVHMLEKVIVRNTPEALKASEAQMKKLDEATRNLVAKDKELHKKAKDIVRQIHVAEGS